MVPLPVLWDAVVPPDHDTKGGTVMARELPYDDKCRVLWRSYRKVVYCVVCHRCLPPNRVHVDTCGERCFTALLKRQRKGV